MEEKEKSKKFNPRDNASCITIIDKTSIHSREKNITKFYTFFYIAPKK
jgi:hypothetical protein